MSLPILRTVEVRGASPGGAHRIVYHSSSIAVLGLLLLQLVGQARNADLSDWTVNLSESALSTALGVADKVPEIVIEGATVHALWFASHPDGGHEVCYRRSLDRGQSWEPTYRFYRQEAALRDPVVRVTGRSLAVEGGRVHIVFGAYGDGSNSWFGQLVYLRSPDGGVTFEPARVLWSSGGVGADSSPWHALDVRIRASAGRLGICYRRQPNWYDHLSAHVLVSSDGGVSFRDVEAATGGGGGGWIIEDFLCQGDLTAVLCYQAAYHFGLQKGDLHLSVSVDGGQTFRQTLISVPSSNDTHLTYASHDQHYTPVIDGSGRKVWVVWRGLDQEDQPGVFVRRSMDGGQSYEDPINLSRDLEVPASSLTSQHTVLADGDRVHVLMHTSSSRLFLRSSANAGASFGPAVEVTDADSQSLASEAWWPVLSLLPGRGEKPDSLHVTCAGLKDFVSTDGGLNFVGGVFPGPRWSLRSSSRPQVASDDQGNLHTVSESVWTWYSTAVFGDPDVLYARLDAEPRPDGTRPLALRLETLKNRGDGSGLEKLDTMIVPGRSGILPREAFTVECWVKSNRANPGAETYFVEKEGPGAGGAWETFLLGQWRSGQADVRLATETDGYVLVEGEALPAGEWRHLAVSYDARAEGDNLLLYVDGELVGTTRAEGLVKAGQGPLYLGGDMSQRSDGVVELDEVRIWGRALTAGEIQTGRERPVTVPTPGLAAYYPLDGSARDASGSGHHGILTYREGFVPGNVQSPPTPSLRITSATILGAELGRPVEYQIAANHEATTFSTSALPAGLVLDPLTGLISGVPAETGLFSVDLGAVGEAGTTSLRLTVVVRQAIQVVFDNNNPAGVMSGPPQPTQFQVARPTLVTYIMDYHYFNGGVLPGTIALEKDDGTVYGPWPAAGRIGQGGVLNAYWEVWPRIILPAGTYTVVDSHPATWSYNTQSGNSGISTIRGIQAPIEDTQVLAYWASNHDLTGDQAIPTADPDLDQRPNWVEIVTGTHPARAEPAPRLVATATLAGETPAVRYRICSGGTGVPGSDYAVHGARMLIEVTRTITDAHWRPASDLLDVASTTRTSLGDGTEIVEVPVNSARLQGEPWFIRQTLSRLVSE